MFLRNPIFEREFTALCRTRRWFAMRTSLVFLLCLTLWVILIAVEGESEFRNLDEMGRTLFAAAVFAQVLFVCVITPGITADLIVSERRRETLDILLTTQLRPTGIILGKLFSRLALVLVIVAASFPVVSVTLLYGGVRGGQVVGLFVVTVGTVLILAGPALLVSTFARKLGTAAFLAYVLPAVAGIAGPIVTGLVLGWNEDTLEVFYRTHILGAAAVVAIEDLYTDYLVPHPGILGLAPHFVFLILSALVAALCVVLSVIRLSREKAVRGYSGGGATRAQQVERDLIALKGRIESRRNGSTDSLTHEGLLRIEEKIEGLLAQIREHQEVGNTNKAWRPIAYQVRALESETRKLTGDPGLRTATRHKRRGRLRHLTAGFKHPMIWKEANLVNASHSRVLFWVAIVLLLGAEALFLLAVDTRSLVGNSQPHMVLVTIQAVLLMVLVAMNGATSVIGEREQGTLDLLRVTLLRPGDITTGKVVGTLRSVAVPAAIPVLHLLIVSFVTPVTAGGVIGFTVSLAVLLSFFGICGVRYSTVSRRAPVAVLRSMALLGILIFGVPLVLPVLIWLAGGDGDLSSFLFCSNPTAVAFMPGSFLNSDTGAGNDIEFFTYTLVWLLAYASFALVRFVRLPAAYRAALRREE